MADHLHYLNEEIRIGSDVFTIHTVKSFGHRVAYIRILYASNQDNTITYRFVQYADGMIYRVVRL